MNTQTQISVAPQMNSVGLLNLEAFELSQRIAKMLSNSTLVPEQYRAVLKVKIGKDNFGNMQYRDEENPNGLSNCIIALNMANRMGADPLMVMQNLYLIEGRPAWSSQFIMAAINSCGRFSALRFELEDLGEKEVEYQETSWVNGRKQNSVKKITVKNLTCVAWAIERETGERIESSKITMEMAVKEGWYGKNGSKWQTMPEQMLRYRAASFFGRVYAPELLMGLRSAEEEQDKIIDVTPEKDISPNHDIAQIRSDILRAKSPADLDEAESKILMLSDDVKREELLKMISAQAKKFKSAVSNAVNGQNSTSNDVEKNPEPIKEEVPPIEEIEVKKPTSLEVRKEYLLKMNDAQSLAELNELHEEFIINKALTATHLTYLKDTYTQHKEKFKPAAQDNAQKVPVNEIKSGQIIGGLKIQINNAKSIDALEQVAKTIQANKPDITQNHLNDVLSAYAARKNFIEDQLSMFDGVSEKSWLDAAIARIESASNQDDINAEYTDPMYEELSDKDKQRLDLAAQKRETELQG
ncbi:recombinase family protein [Acinetobacter sp. ANC 4640]